MWRFATSFATRRCSFGVGLLVILMMTGMIAMIAGTMALRAQRSHQATQRQMAAAAAEDAAYSGLQVAVAAVSQVGEGWPGAANLTPLPNRTDLAYRVLVNSNHDGAEPKSDDDGTEIPPESLYVKSLSYLNDVPTAGMAAILAQERGMTFNYPAFGSEGLSLSGSTIQARNAAGEAVPGEAPVRTNGDQSGAIALADGSFVDGNVVVGPSADPAVALTASGGSGFSGDAETAGAELPLPSSPAAYSDSAPSNQNANLPLPIPIPFVGLPFLNIGVSVVSPGTYNQIRVGDGFPILEPSITGGGPVMNLLFMESGTYYCNSFVSEDSFAIIVPSGPTVIHVRDRVAFSAGTTGISGDSPTWLQIYQTEPGGEVSLERTSGPMVLASQSDVVTTGSAILGALYGRNVSLNGTELSYSTELDGQVLNDTLRGHWTLYGVRNLNPSEVGE